jgi:hypothetical protein
MVDFGRFLRIRDKDLDLLRNGRDLRCTLAPLFILAWIVVGIFSAPLCLGLCSASDHTRPDQQSAICTSAIFKAFMRNALQGTVLLPFSAFVTSSTKRFSTQWLLGEVFHPPREA